MQLSLDKVKGKAALYMSCVHFGPAMLNKPQGVFNVLVKVQLQKEHKWVSERRADTKPNAVFVEPDLWCLW